MSTPVRLITFNVKMLPFGSRKVGGISHLLRAKRLVKMLGERITPTTVVCLQEAFCVGPRWKLEQSLRQLGLRPIGDPPAYSGLIVATNLRGASLRFSEFTAEHGVDGMSRKGVTGASLAVPGEASRLMLFTTHLQAAFSKPAGRFDAIQRSQLAQIRERVLAHVRAAGPAPLRVVLCGDMNVIAEKPYPTATSDYTRMCGLLGVARDMYRAQHVDKPGYTYLDFRGTSSERLDYILDLAHLPYEAPADVRPLTASNCDILTLIADLTL